MQPGSEISIPPKDPEPTTSFHLTNGPNEDLSLRLELNPEASKLTVSQTNSTILILEDSFKCSVSFDVGGGK